MNNRKFTILAAAVIALAASCNTKVTIDKAPLEGVLSFASFDVVSDDTVEIAGTKALSPASGTYIITVSDAQSTVLSTTYSAVKADGYKVKLPAGDYTLSVCSTDEAVPAAMFEYPIYGATKDFTIKAGQTTEIGSVTCKLLQCKVSVSYDEAFLACVTGDGSCSVEVSSGHPLKYTMTYSAGRVFYDQAAGYFAVNNGQNTTMVVTFKGSINGSSQKMTSSITGVKPAQWRQIKFIRKVDKEGNATFALEITGYIEDKDLDISFTAPLEASLEDDPDAPQGDGGITLDFAQGCTMFTDLGAIVVPSMTTPMDLRLKATVPNGIKKFVVEISTQSPAFQTALDMAGGNILDLVNPSEDAGIVFQVVPFPHGKDLVGKTEVDFDLSAAQEPILAFPGTHNFKMVVTDSKFCKKEIPVVMIVEE